MSPVELQEAQQIAQEDRIKTSRESLKQTIIGVGFLAAAGAGLYGATSENFEDSMIAKSMPFSEQAQNAINSVDDRLADTGMVLGLAGLGAVGAVKIGRRYSSRLESIDERSSQELSDDGHRNVSLSRRALRAGAAGGFPVIVAASAGLGSIFAAVGTEVTEGPSRPIEAFGTFAEGESMITQYPEAMPMLTSVVSEARTVAIKKQASERGITATSIDLGLNNISYDGKTFTALTIGVDAMKVPSELAFDKTSECSKAVPVIIDKAAGIQPNSIVKINGVESLVVGQAADTSAINRIGIVMNQEALNKCVNKNEQTVSHAVILDTDITTARDIYEDVATPEEVNAVISKDEYIENSRNFWESNVKPITNNLALQAGLFSGLAVAMAMGSRMLRSRREIGLKMVSGESDAHIRSTEALRATKDGIVGSTLGVLGAMAITPLVNLTESGMKAGVGRHEIMVGLGVGMLSSVGGALSRIVRLRKFINPSESVRV